MQVVVSASTVETQKPDGQLETVVSRPITETQYLEKQAVTEMQWSKKINWRHRRLPHIWIRKSREEFWLS